MNILQKKAALNWEKSSRADGGEKAAAKIVLIAFILNKQTVIPHFPPTHSLNNPTDNQQHIEAWNFTRSKFLKKAEKWKINSKLWVIKIIKLIYFIWYKNDIRVKFSIPPSSFFRCGVKMAWRGWIVSLFYHHSSSFIHPFTSLLLLASELLLFTEFIHSANPLMPNIF